MLPPSGVSTGSIIPHCDPCSKRGPTTLALASRGKFIFLKCAIKELYDKRFNGWTNPTRLVCVSAPQFPLNPFLNPSSTILSLKKSL